jgi:hypothetical protein
VSKKPKAAASETMHAYVPQGVQAGPLSTTARIALQGAQSQLNGSVPMVLADRAAPVGVPVKKGTPEEKSVVESSSKRTRPILLGVVAAVVFAAVVWNFYPGNPGVGHGGGAGGLRATAASATSTQATLPWSGPTRS